MASAGLRKELECSVCLSLYTDPVTLRCGHNFCWICIDQVLNTQDESGVYSCPECREEFQDRPVLIKNRTLSNIVENFLSTHWDRGDSPVPTAISSLSYDHLGVPSKGPEHVLTEPSTDLEKRICSVHKDFLNYFCIEDAACICVSCLAEEHRGHKVELLHEVSEKKKKQLIKELQDLITEGDETEEKVQYLEKRWKTAEEAAARETERVSGQFNAIRKWLDDLEKRILSDVSKKEKKLARSLYDMVKKLEIKSYKRLTKMRHIVNLCNTSDPLTVLLDPDTNNFWDLEENGADGDTGGPDGGDGENTVGGHDGGDGENTGVYDGGDAEDTVGGPDGSDGEDTAGRPDGSDGETTGGHDGGDGETTGGHDGGDGETTGGHDGGDGETTGGHARGYDDEEDTEEHDGGDEKHTRGHDGDDDEDIGEYDGSDEDDTGVHDVENEDTGDFCDPEGNEYTGGHIKGEYSMELISHISHTLFDIVRSVMFHIQDPADILLDVNTAGNSILLSDDLKAAACTRIDQNRAKTAERFQLRQVISSRRFTSGRHYWDVEISGSRWWRVGMCYPSIDRKGGQSYIGDNEKSWGLYGGQGYVNRSSVMYGGKEIWLPHQISSDRVRVYVDYEAGQLSFYELCDPIRHLHTFTTTFTEPLHAALCVWEGSIKILGGSRGCEERLSS